MPSNLQISHTEIRRGNGITTIVTTGSRVGVLEGNSESERLEAIIIVSEAKAIKDLIIGFRVTTIISEAEAVSKESMSLVKADAQSKGAVLNDRNSISRSKFAETLNLET